MPWFYHPDMKTQHFHFQFLKQGVVNIYQYIQDNNSNLPYKDTFNYLPLTYLSLGSINTVLSPILGNSFSVWLYDWGSSQNSNPKIPFFIFILKIPYLIIDLLTAFFLYKIYKNKKVVYFWLFNPISLYLIYILGNFDIIPAFLTLFSIYLNKNNKFVYSYLIIGLAIAIKMYPIMFVPFLILNNKKDLLRQSFLSLFSLLPLIVSALPFIFSNSFSQAFLGSGLTQKIIETKFIGLPVFPMVYLLILLNLYFSKNKNRIEIAFLQTMLFFLGLVKFHAQWIIWFLPSIIILLDFKNIKSYLIIFTLLISIFYIILLNDNYLFWGHLIPIDSSFVSQTSPYQLIKLKFNLDVDLLRNYIHTLILILGSIISLSYVKKDN